MFILIHESRRVNGGMCVYKVIDFRYDNKKEGLLWKKY